MIYIASPFFTEEQLSFVKEIDYLRVVSKDGVNKKSSIRIITGLKAILLSGNI